MTLINHRYRFVFIHIPKNAGTSVARYLAQLSTYRDLEVGATALGEAIAPHVRDRFGLQKHATLSEIGEVMGSGELAGYRTIAVLRDHVVRVRSILAFLHNWSGWASLDPAYAPFESEVMGYETIDAFVASDLFLMPGPDRMFQPQSAWLASDERDPGAIDHVLQFEHLQRDLDRMVTELGLPRHHLRRPLEHANASSKLRNPPPGGRRNRLKAHVPGLRPAKLPVLSTGPASSTTLDRVRDRYAIDYELLAAVGAWIDPPNQRTASSSGSVT
jgi:hypothetical protein